MAPELTKVGAHDHRVDLYSLGLVAFRHLTGRDAFEGRSADLLRQRREQDAPLASKLRADTPTELVELLRSLLARNPNERPHDALTLLERIAHARGTEHTPFTEDEILESTSGGPVVGREREMQRFEQTLDSLAARSEPDSQNRGRTPPKIPDPVLILTGEPGCGATSLARAFAHRARQKQIPVLLLSGRHPGRSEEGPLTHLLAGSRSLADIQDPVSSRPGRVEPQHAQQRTVEALLQTLKRASENRPVVVVAEDASLLTENGQRAIGAVTRHLCSQSEHDRGRPAQRIAVVVDAGAENADAFVLEEAEDPESAVVRLGPLTADDVGRIADARLPGSTLIPDQINELATASSGNPGRVASALGEAARRQLLSNEAGQWHWRVEDWTALAVYEEGTPHIVRLVDGLPGSDLHALRLLATIGLPVPEQLLQDLGLSPELQASLVGVLQRAPWSSSGDDYRIEFTNPGYRAVLLKGVGRVARLGLSARAAEVLEGCVAPDLRLRRAELVLEAAGPRNAIDELEENLAVFSRPDGTWVGADLLSQVLAADESLARAQPLLAILSDPRVSLAALAPSALELIAGAFVIRGEDDGELILRLSEALERHQRYAAAIRLLDRAAGILPPFGGSLRTVRVRLLLNSGQTDAALEDRELSSAESMPPASCFVRPRDRVAYALVAAQLAHHVSDGERALQLLREAEEEARNQRDLTLRASVCNNLGILHAINKQVDPAHHYLSRAARLKALLGDVAGSARTRFNVGVLLHRFGRTSESVRQLRAAVALSVRHGLSLNLVKILRELSALYDSQRNPQLALGTLERALRVSDRRGLASQSAVLRADAAPLAAATGRPNRAVALLQEAQQMAGTQGAHIDAQIILAQLQSALHSGSLSAFGDAMADLTARRKELFSTFGAERRLLVTVCDTIWASRATERSDRAGNAELPDSSRLLRQENSRSPETGPRRRLWAERLLAYSRRVPAVTSTPMWQECLAALEESGERAVLARLLARPALELAEADPRRAASVLGTSLRQLGYSNDVPAPDEVRECARLLSEGTPLAASPQDSVGDVRASLHALIVESGSDEGGADTRRTVALRTILDATARMDAGGSLEDLLGDMTASVIAITNAERSCVVLVENVVEMEVRVATSASGEARSVEIEDLSHTVIRRVLDSRSPLLLHDVYEDAELVERPSIASFELRSILCVPIVRQDTLYGVLYADNASAAGSFDSVDLEVLTLYAKQAAAALQTNQLIADVQTSLRDLKKMQAQLVRGERLRALGELSSGVAHEFNNLLTSILARVQLISLGSLSPSLRTDLTIIERACLDAASVVRRLQTFSRSERQGHFRELDLREVCQDAMDFLNPLWSNRARRGKSPIDVALDCPASYPVRGDATELREVVTNLIKNALEVLDDGGAIQVDVWSVDGVVKLAVADNGPGIDPETLPHIFEPFFTTKGESGTGLGLCLSQQIAERHRGSLSVDSTQGSGTTFTLALPLLSPGEDSDSMDAPPRVSSEEQRGLILVVDDEATVRDPLCSFLEQSGFDVRSASSGSDALAIYDTDDPDVVVSDVSMPGMTGFELCRALVARGRRARVILMSGKTDTNDSTAASLAGAAAFIPKPFTLSQLAEVLERVVRSKEEPSTHRRQGLGDR